MALDFTIAFMATFCSVVLHYAWYMVPTAFSNAFIKIVSLLDITDSRAHKHLLANFEGFWPLLFLTFKHLGHNLLHRVFGGGC